MTSPHGGSDHYAKLLLETDVLREHLIRDVIDWADLPRGGRGLDAGCGVGSLTLLLAEAVGPKGNVTGMDTSPDFLKIAGERAKSAGHDERIDFRKGDVNNLPFGPEVFDWAWSADCVGAATGDPFKQVEGLARAVRPGGIVTVLAWSAQNLLPGYPRLEARLNATDAGIAPFKHGMEPEMHLFRAKAWLEQAGLERVTARSFVADVQAPLTDNIRNALVLLFDMRWGDKPDTNSPDDRDLYKRLTSPSSPDFILNTSDYYAFFTYTAFRGSKPL
jgi:demethylmenaquinone methyltransferase/2-methoxy-6-polyprenyl-1,4-benzoquinol methylase